MNITPTLRRVTSALFLISSPITFAQDNVSGYWGAELRYFANEAQYPEQEDHAYSVSAYVEYYRDFGDGNQQFNFSAFTRFDPTDEERSNLDIREMYGWQDFSSVQVYAGIRKIFWGVTESVHLVDVINQTDQAENINGDEKLGQPMIQFITEQNWGTIEAFVLPYFRERTFPGVEGRLRPSIPIDNDNALYQSKDEEKHIDYALRWSHYIDIWDFGLSYFSGTSRTPQFVPTVTNDQLQLTPYYSLIEQTGLDIQATINAWLWKLEVISVQEKEANRHTLLAGGLEYTFYTLGGGNSDLGVIAEYQFDDRAIEKASSAQNDIAFGARWALNDIDGSELLFLINKDLEYSNAFASVEVSRRINDNWKLELQAISFIDSDETSFEYALRKDNHVQVELRHYF